MKAPSFGALLKHYRVAAGLSQEALAERANLSTRAISDLERSINQTPRSATLNALLPALALSEEQRQVLIAAARVSALIDVGVATPLYVLPVPPTQLIGREQDIARVIALLRGDRVRLLTLLGPAGVGKTHLGLDIAHRLRGDFKDGVVFVALAATADAAVAPALIAQALRLRESADISPAQQTSDFLAEKHLLLVLDNFEQVIAAATVVAELLQNCPHLRILVTSRTPLGLRGEQEMPVAPLALEAAKTLFLQRALAAQPALESEDAIVAAICEQVDRLPLAIELAVAQIKVLSLRQLLTRLQRRLPLLKHGARDAAARQQTMQAAIAWSDDLLTPPARQLLRIVSLCEGGCSEETLAFLCAEDSALTPGDVLTHLHELVEASLLSQQAFYLGNRPYPGADRADRLRAAAVRPGSRPLSGKPAHSAQDRQLHFHSHLPGRDGSPQQCRGRPRAGRSPVRAGK